MDHYNEMPEIRKLCESMFTPHIDTINSHIKALKEFTIEEPFNYGYIDMYSFSGSIPEFFDSELEEDIKFEKLLDNLEPDKARTREEIKKNILDNNRKNKSFKYLVKYNQSWNYVIAIIREYSTTKIAIRKFWRDSSLIEETNDYDYLSLKNNTDFASHGKMSLVLEKYANSDFTEFPSRPSLSFILKNGFKYCDGRDRGAIADFEIKKELMPKEEVFEHLKEKEDVFAFNSKKDALSMKEVFDYNSLISVMLDLGVVLDTEKEEL